MRRTGCILAGAAVLIGAWLLVDPASAQQAPAAPADSLKPHIHGDDDGEPARTPKERNAKIKGRFADDKVLDSATQKIRGDAAGPCDSVSSAVDAGNSVAITCDRGKHAYFLQRGAKGLEYVAPPLIAAKDRPAAK